MNEDATARSLRDMLWDALPPDAREIQWDDGGIAYAWRPEGHRVPMAAVAMRKPDGQPRLLLLAKDPGQVDAATVTELAVGGIQSMRTRHRIVTISCFSINAVPGIMATYARRFEGPQAAAAADRAAELSFGRDDAHWEWMSDPVQGPSAIAFWREHPWLADEIADDGRLRARLVAGHREDVAVAACKSLARYRMEGLGDDDLTPEAAAATVEVLRGFRFSNARSGRRASLHVRAVSRMPRDTWPGPIPPVGPGFREAHDDTEAFFLLAPLASPSSLPVTRPVRSVLNMRGRRWAEYLASLHARCGLPPLDEDLDRDRPASMVMSMADAVDSCVKDACDAFASEVLAPAMMAGGSDPRRSAWYSRSMAFHVLLGNRTLPGLCEVSRDWHARAASMAAAVQALHGDDGASGPALFADVDLGGGIYGTCLRTPEDLAAEGASRPDVSGAPGLAHCVAGYADAVLDGRTSILSLRRRLPAGSYERLSTAEIRYGPRHEVEVVQHRGHRNAPPPPESVEALPRLLTATADGARRALAAHRPVRRRSDSEVIHEAGAWTAMRDLWSFALTRPQRAMGPEGFVALMAGERQ